MKSNSLIYLAASVALAASSLVTSTAHDVDIPVTNGSFETLGAFTANGSGEETWQALPTSTGGVWEHTTNAPYGVYGVAAGSHFTTAAHGSYILNTGDAAGSGPVSQALTYTVAIGDHFTLEFDVAQALSGSGSGTLVATILVDGVPIATKSFSTSLAAGAWDHKTLTGTATRTGALSISFAKGTGSPPWLDNVTLREGPPTVVFDMKITSFSIAADQVTLTWSSLDAKTYRIASSIDLVDWTTILKSGIDGQTTSTTDSATFTLGEKVFFRVEEE